MKNWVFKEKIRGWLPKEPILQANKQRQIRWRSPRWITLTLVTMISVAFVAYTGVQTYVRWSNPELDVTANYFEKNLNSTSVHLGDFVQVTFRVGWHGHILPEFERNVKVVDELPQNGFVLVDGTNIHEYCGSGGSDQFSYTLKVTGQGGVVELPKPKLFLDGTEISLTGSSPVLTVLS